MRSSLLLLLSTGAPQIIAVVLTKPGNLFPALALPTHGSDGPYCVSSDQWPDWQGLIDRKSCADALRAMMTDVPQDERYTFWTGESRDRPLHTNAWRLPVHKDGGIPQLGLQYCKWKLPIPSLMVESRYMYLSSANAFRFRQRYAACGFGSYV